MCGHSEVCSLLLDRGADVEAAVKVKDNIVVSIAI
jgi:hypothetical protein